MMNQMTLPRNIAAGAGSIRLVNEIVMGRRAQSVCLLVDEAVYKNSGISQLISEMKAQGIKTDCITAVKAEPTFRFVSGLLKSGDVRQADVFVAVGGGSVMDTAKILSACRTNPFFADHLHDASYIKNPAAYLVAVPTTAGTGAEATPNAILLDEDTNTKLGIISKLMVAQAVILDPDLTKTLPKSIAASTGTDAMAHALESFISKKANCFSDLYGLAAMRLIFQNLETACKDDSSRARENMLLASFYAGACLSSASTCAVHAMAYPLSGFFHVPHGASIAMLLCPVMERIQNSCCERLSAAYIYCFDKSFGSVEKNAAAFVDELKRLVRAIGAAAPMTAYGVKKEDLSRMALSAMEVKRLFDQTPTALDGNDLIGIYEKAL